MIALAAIQAANNPATAATGTNGHLHQSSDHFATGDAARSSMPPPEAAVSRGRSGRLTAARLTDRRAIPKSSVKMSAKGGLEFLTPVPTSGNDTLAGWQLVATFDLIYDFVEVGPIRGILCYAEFLEFRMCVFLSVFALHLTELLEDVVGVEFEEPI